VGTEDGKPVKRYSHEVEFSIYNSNSARYKAKLSGFPFHLSIPERKEDHKNPRLPKAPTVVS
jgi:hypothetical protein